MPIYNFNIDQGSRATDTKVDLPNAEGACREAIFVFADLARDISIKLNEHPNWVMVVKDSTGQIVCRLTVAMEGAT